MNYAGDRLLIGSQREREISYFRPWILFVVPLTAILLQVYIPLFFQFFENLDLPLMVTVYFTLMRRSAVNGTFLGAAVGLAQDSLSKNPLGMFGIVKTLVGYFAASVGMRFEVDHPFIRFLLAYFFFLFHQVFFWMLSRALIGLPVGFDLGRTLGLGALNALVALSVFRFLDRLRERR
ncbi:MAG: rod shape-determining protein MreD [Bryobacteraceae bacterium]